MKRKSWVGVAVIGLMGFGLLCAAQIAEASNNASPATAGEPSPASASPPDPASVNTAAATDVTSFPPVSQSMVDAMKSDGGFTFIPTEVSGTDLTPEKVAELATSAFGLATGKPAALSFGRLTIPFYGKRLSDDPRDERISRYADDRPVWLVRFNDVPQPRSGPVGEDGEPVNKGPASVPADLWVSLDAVTGEILYGATLFDPGRG